MTEIKVDNIVNLAGTGKPNFPVSPTVGASGDALSTLNTYSYTSSGTEPSSPKNGALWWDSTNEKVYVYIDGEFKEVELGASASSAVWYGDRGFNFFGISDSSTNIEYWDMTTSGNASSFGSISGSGTRSSPAASDGTYVYVQNGSTNYEYITSATTGNATSYATARFGKAKRGSMETDGSTLVHVIGQYNSATYYNQIDQLSVGTGTTGGTATSFGSLSAANEEHESVANGTRMVLGGGRISSGAAVNTIEYLTFQTAGNGTDFGDLTQARYANGGMGTGEGDRGVWAGGSNTGDSPLYNIMDYVTVSTTGNATDFGDLLVANYFGSGCANATKGHYVCGYTSAGVNTIQQITLATTGNATDFGDMTSSLYFNRCASGAAA